MSLPPFQRLLDDHRDRVWAYAAAAVGPDHADDVFQETFLAALAAYPGLRPGSDARAWVLTIARHKAIDHHRARRREHEKADRARGRRDPAATGADRDPELWRTVRALPPKQRDAVVLRYVEDLPYRDIGRVLGCTEAAARRSAYEGVSKLREEWR